MSHITFDRIQLLKVYQYSLQLAKQYEYGLTDLGDDRAIIVFKNKYIKKLKRVHFETHSTFIEYSDDGPSQILHAENFKLYMKMIQEVIDLADQQLDSYRFFHDGIGICDGVLSTMQWKTKNTDDIIPWCYRNGVDPFNVSNEDMLIIKLTHFV